ncbi:MAG: 30S ribosome-binding factor RbfA [Cyclobacteriaceae bacterium]|nr:30S ribosome-binding factor RbfA [Cyclobacteriaceae bacterium]
MESKRQIKVARLMQKELSEIFQRDAKSMFTNNIISVTRTSVSPDLGLVKVWLSFLKTNDAHKSLEYIDSKKKEIRWMLGNRISKQMRRVPELAFFLDDGAEHAFKMDELLKNLNIPPEGPEEGDSVN